MTTTTDLIHRLENATEGQERELLGQAFRAVFGPMPPRVHGGSQELTDWLAIHNSFYRKLVAKAWTSAAEMLVPEGWSPAMDYFENSCTLLNDGDISERHHTRAPFPWAALAAASVKARG